MSDDAKAVAVGFAIGAVTGGIGFYASTAIGGVAAGSAASFAAGTLQSAVITGALRGAALAALQVVLAPDQPGAPPAIPRNVVEAISPVRYVVGETRVAPPIAYIEEDPDDMHVVYLISEGACEGITALYVDGDKIEFTRTNGNQLRPITNERYHDKMTITEYFAADGTQGTEAQAAMTGWTRNHKLNGISWVWVRFSQDSVVYNTRPEMNFVVKGKKLSYPTDAAGTMSTPAWTDNAAIIRYWWITERLGIDKQYVDYASFETARVLSGTEWTAGKRTYTINGVISSGDNIGIVETQMNAACAGHVVLVNNTHFFRFGQDRALRAALTYDDIVAPIEITHMRVSETYNRITGSMRQSAPDDYEPITLPVYADPALVMQDGRELTDTRPNYDYVNEPQVAFRLLQIGLRYSQHGAALSVTANLDSALSQVIPGDRISVPGFEHCLVTQITYNLSEPSIEFSLRHIPADLYAVGYDAYNQDQVTANPATGTFSLVPNSSGFDINVQRGWTGNDIMEMRFRLINEGSYEQIGTGWHYRQTNPYGATYREREIITIQVISYASHPFTYIQVRRCPPAPALCGAWTEEAVFNGLDGPSTF